MKRIFDLPHEEILLVQDIEKFVSVEMMLAGVSLKPVPVDPKSRVTVPTEAAWDIGGWTFSSRDAAEKILEALSSVKSFMIHSEYDYEIGASFNKGPLPDYRIPEIKDVKIYSRENCGLVRSEIREAVKLKKAYEAELKDWESAQSIISDIRRTISSFINIHHQIAHGLSEYKRIYDIYRESADGNEEIAKRFFDKNEANSFKIDNVNLVPVINKEITPEKFALSLERINFSVCMSHLPNSEILQHL